MKKSIDVLDYAGHICKAMKNGVLLTAKSQERVNTMTIGWGTIGIEWNKPIFIAYIRESRYTRQLLEENGEFTVNIPYGECDSKILSYCGTKSGRTTDKIKDLNLTLECKVIYRQKQDLNAVPAEMLERFYPAAGERDDRDKHIAYYGEIVNAYLIEG